MGRAARTTSITLTLLALTGCGVWFPHSQAELDLINRLDKRASALNAKVKFAFDPDRETIVSESAPYLVRDYRLNVAHEVDDYYAGRPEHYRTYRLVRYPGCSRLKAESDRSYSLDRSDYPDICYLKLYGEEPPRAALMAKLNWRTLIIDGYKIARYDITIRRPDGRRATLIFFPGLSNFPQKAAPQIAAALGLPRRNKMFANLPGPTDVDRWIAASAARGDGFKYAWLDGLADGNQQPSNEGFHAGLFEPAQIGKRAEKLVLRLEAMAPVADKMNFWLDVGNLLARLPQEDWVQYRERILTALIRAPRRERDAQKRLVDMGAAAGPMLALASSDANMQKQTAIAACRIGAPVGPQLRSNFLAAWKHDNAPRLVSFSYQFGSGQRSLINRQIWNRCTAEGKKRGPPDNIALSACWAYPKTTSAASPTYLALKRMGYGAEADAMAKHQYSTHWKKTYASVGPRSPAEICGSEKQI